MGEVMIPKSFAGFVILLVVVTTDLSRANERDCNVQNFQVLETFNISKYLGTWYEMKWVVPFDVPVSDRYRDYKHVYAMQSEDEVVGAVSARDSSETCLYYNIFLKSTNTTGKLLFLSSQSDAGTPYWIIDTDYTQYSLVYGCSKLFENGTCDSARVWIWSRKMSLSSSLLESAINKMKDLCVDTADLIDTSHDKECPPNPNSSIALLSCITITLCAVFVANFISYE